MACLTRMSLVGPAALFIATMIWRVGFPSSTLKLALLVKLPSCSGPVTPEMTSMSPASSALFIALGSEMYLKITFCSGALVPQYRSLRTRVRLAPRFQLSNLKGPVPTGLVARLVAGGVVVARWVVLGT